MQVTKQEVEKIFGSGVEFVGSNETWCSLEEYEVQGQKKTVRGRILVTHGHQGDIFNRPFSPGTGCPENLAKKVVFVFKFFASYKN